MINCSHHQRKPFNLTIFRGNFLVIAIICIQSIRRQMQQKSSEGLTVEQTLTFKDEEFELLVKNKLKLITSCNPSPSRKHFLITTVYGFVLVNPTIASFTRFQNDKSPFFKNPDTPCGAKMGSILQKRSQVALLPNFDSRHFCSTVVYIYDYSMGIMLSSFDCVLPIKQLALTDKYLISSNNKRVLLFDYTQGPFPHSEQHYLQAHKQQINNNIRYLRLQCHLYEPQKPELCECGHFVLCRMATYLKMFYVRVSFTQGVRNKLLYCYDQATNQARPFEGMQTWTNDFQFTATEDGKYLIVADDYGRRIKVYNLKENYLQTVLHLSREPRSILSMGIITLPNQQEWVIASRQKQNDQATMHLFKLAKTAPTDLVESNYKRYFRLYRQLGVTQDIFAEKDTFLGPEYYLIKQKLFCLALEGQFCQLIDLGRAGLHQKVKVKDHRRLEETPYFNA